MNDSRQEQFINTYRREIVHLLINRPNHETQYDITLSLLVNNEIISDQDLTVLLEMQSEIDEPDHGQMFFYKMHNKFRPLITKIEALIFQWLSFLMNDLFININSVCR